MRNRFFALALAAVLLLGACAAPERTMEPSGESEQPESATESTAEAAGQKDFTLMVYMIGSDLEASAAAASNDLAEMTENHPDLDAVNVLVYTGGSPAWHSDVPEEVNAVMELTAQGFSTLETYPEQSMGQPDSLTRFLNYGVEHFPAEQYGLILWDHGNGPVMGYGKDLRFDGDALTLPEIGQALADSPFDPTQKLSWIGFDACLMASAELCCTVRDYAEYLVASQETEPGFGWNYAFLSELDGKTDAQQTTASIVDAYVSYCTDYYAENTLFQSDVTLAAIDLSYTDELEKAIDGLFSEAASSVSGGYGSLALERIETRALGRASTGSEYDLVDLDSLMDEMAEQYPEQTAAVQEILSQMVTQNGTNTTGCCGLSLYYPYYNKDYYRSEWREEYSQLGCLSRYQAYLQRYEQVWLGTDMREDFSDGLTAQQEDTGVYTLQLTPEQAENYASGGYFILRRLGEETYQAVYYSEDVEEEDGLLTASFGGEIPYLVDLTTGEKAIVPMRQWDVVDGVARYTAGGVLQPFEIDDFRTYTTEGWKDQRVTLHLSGDGERIDITGVYEDEAGKEEKLQGTSMTSGKQKEADLSEWRILSLSNIDGHYLTRNEDGTLEDYWSWPKNNSTFSYYEQSLEDEFAFQYLPLYEDGYEYYVMFRLMDVQGNLYSSELLPAALEQEPEGDDECVQLQWDGDGTLCHQENGVSVSLYASIDYTTGQPAYQAEIRNESGDNIYVALDDITVNETVYVSGGWEEYVPAGTTGHYYLGNIEKACRWAKLDTFEQLDFTVRVKDSASRRSLGESQVSMQVMPGAIPQGEPRTVLGAVAEPQTLGSAGGNTLQLGGISYASDGSMDYLQMKLRLDGTSGEASSKVYGVVINGVYFDGVVFGEQGAAVEKIVERNVSDLSDCGIYTIHSMELVADLDENGAVEFYPVQLSSTGAESGPGEEMPGTVLYEDETVRITAEVQQVELGGTAWKLWVENKSEDMLEFSEVDEKELTSNTGKSLLFWDMEVPPHSRAEQTMELYADDAKQITGTLQWEIYAWSYSAEEQIIGQAEITLPEWQEGAGA